MTVSRVQRGGAAVRPGQALVPLAKGVVPGGQRHAERRRGAVTLAAGAAATPGRGGAGRNPRKPFGKKELGPAGVAWLAGGARRVAKELREVEEAGGSVESRLLAAGGAEGLCAAALAEQARAMPNAGMPHPMVLAAVGRHAPTLWDHVVREVAGDAGGDAAANKKRARTCRSYGRKEVAVEGVHDATAAEVEAVVSACGRPEHKGKARANQKSRKGAAQETARAPDAASNSAPTPPPPVSDADRRLGWAVSGYVEKALALLALELRDELGEADALAETMGVGGGQGGDSVPVRGLSPGLPETESRVQEALGGKLAAEEAQQVGAGGRVLRGLVVLASSLVSGGRVYAVGVSGSEALPEHRISPGDIVRAQGTRLGGDGKTLAKEGVLVDLLCSVHAVHGDRLVLRVTGTAPDSAKPEGETPDGEIPTMAPRVGLLQYAITRVARDDVTNRRSQNALEALRRASDRALGGISDGGEEGSSPGGNAEGLPSIDVLRVLFSDPAELAQLKKRQGAPPVPSLLNVGLNASQQRAVANALDQKLPVSCVWGPPGTGKTAVVEEIVRQAVVRGERVLVVAPSNVACDAVLLRLVQARELPAGAPQGAEVPIRVVRVGNPGRISNAPLVQYSLDGIATALVGDERKRFQEAANAAIRGRNEGTARRALQKLQELDDRTSAQILGLAQVVVCTTAGVGDRALSRARDMTFDLVVVDEAAQAVEASVWGALARGRRLCVSGDPRQLPPTVTSQEALAGGLGQTLMDRVLELDGDGSREGGLTTLLDVTYRLHADICAWSSSALYKGLLSSHESAAGRLLRDADYGATSTDVTNSALYLVDTAGLTGTRAWSLGEDRGSLSGPYASLYFGEETSSGSGRVGTASRMNRGEAALCVVQVVRLLDAGVQGRDVFVLSPYAAQVDLIKAQLEAAGERLDWARDGVQQVRVGTVDGFQGSEAEAVVLSTVRANAAGVLGFLADERRLNVAATRARRHLSLVCDSGTLEAGKGQKGGDTVASLVMHMKRHGTVQPAADVLCDAAGAI